MRTNAKMILDYLAQVPEERRAAIKTLRALIRKHLPKGYEEAFSWGMISYEVPLRVYPDSYNKKPLLYAALASQKNHMAVYLSNIYAAPGARRRFEAAYRAAGKRPDIGASCVRFKKLEDLPLPVVARAVAATPMREFIEHAQAVHAKPVGGHRGSARPRRKQAARRNWA